MNAQTLLLDSLNMRWDKYKAELKNCRHEFSEESVHDFRVMARRLLASLDLLRFLVRNTRVKKIRRILKRQLDDLDELRDTQVLLADISKNIQEVPLLRPLEKYLQGREKKLMRAARRGIRLLKTADLSKRIRRLNRTIQTCSETDLGADLLPAVDKAYARVLQRYEQIDPAQPDTIHRLRIAFKKFRYMVESVHPILEGFPAEQLKQMHDYQTSMGEIQDAEAALHDLTEFEKHAPAAYDPEPVHRYYKEHRALAISRYLEDKSEVLTFWRPAPDQPFPKEK
jgi:CHAD domain-containing protein